MKSTLGLEKTSLHSLDISTDVDKDVYSSPKLHLNKNESLIISYYGNSNELI